MTGIMTVMLIRYILYMQVKEKLMAEMKIPFGHMLSTCIQPIIMVTETVQCKWQPIYT